MLQFENNKGIVLVTLLLFMQIFAFLGLFLLENSVLLQKLSHGTFMQQTIFVIAEELLKNIENNLRTNDIHCLIDVTNSKDLLVQSLDWWQTHACVGELNNYHYYYVVEHLGQDTCASIKNSFHQIADYFRITLNIFEKNMDTREMLQSIIIKPHNADIPCSTHLHAVMKGQQTWCQIN